MKGLTIILDDSCLPAFLIGWYAYDIHLDVGIRDAAHSGILLLRKMIGTYYSDGHSLDPLLWEGPSVVKLCQLWNK